MKKTFRSLVCLALTLLLLMSSLAGAQEAVRLQDDFYEAVNADWMAQAEIPADRSSVGGFEDLATEIEELLMADSAKMLAGEIGADNPRLVEFAKYYALVRDHEKREADGVTPLLPYLEQVDALTSMADYDAVAAEWASSGMPSIMSFTVMADMKDAQKNALYVVAPATILPDVSYYAEDNPTGAALMGIYTDMLTQLYGLLGIADAEQVIADTLAFDQLLVPLTPTAEQSSDFAGMYNPYAFEDFAQMGDAVDLGAFVETLVGETPEQVVALWPAFFDSFNEVVNEENFGIMRSWLKTQIVMAGTQYLNRAYYETGSMFSMAMTGQAEFSDQENADYRHAVMLFSEVIGDYYGRTYFGEDAKQDVIDMVANMIDVYEGRIENNTWLSENTRLEAIKKLDTMAVQIGYPDEIAAFYDEINVDESAGLLGNAFAIAGLMLKDNLSKYGEEVDRDHWPLSADTVNAMYSPMSNTITFPAAILQAPFYSLEQSASENYGGIGGVIAHEISHAFDPNGSQFDEYGNMETWWTEEDYAKFEELTQAMVAEFDGIEHAGGVVNGELTKTENVADAGGLSCVLEIVKGLPDGDLEAMFRNWAVIWRGKMRSELEQMYLTLDVHAPNKLRVNIQVQNFAEFFETFDVQEGDGMWRAPEDRVSIW